MGNKSGLIAIMLGEVGFRAMPTKMPDTDDPIDCSCAHCGKKGDMRPVLDIIQWGMFENHVHTVLMCGFCACHSYVKYHSIDDGCIAY